MQKKGHEYKERSLQNGILGDPGPVSRAGRKGATKVFKHQLSLEHFQTVKRILAPDWTQKTLCIIVPNQRTVSREFFS